MSMVGYVLGYVYISAFVSTGHRDCHTDLWSNRLGDRHGENLSFEEGTGGILHVDFNCLFDKVREPGRLIYTAGVLNASRDKRSRSPRLFLFG